MYNPVTVDFENNEAMLNRFFDALPWYAKETYKSADKLPTPIYDGYVFEGFFTDEDGEPNTITYSTLKISSLGKNEANYELEYSFVKGRRNRP